MSQHTDVEYAFTVKICLASKELISETTSKDYDKYLDKKVLYKISIRELLVYHVFEFDKKGLLHIHGIIKVPKNFYLKKLQEKGFSVHTELMHNREGWLAYCAKDQLDPANQPVRSPQLWTPPKKAKNVIHKQIIKRRLFRIDITCHSETSEIPSLQKLLR